MIKTYGNINAPDTSRSAASILEKVSCNFFMTKNPCFAVELDGIQKSYCPYVNRILPHSRMLTRTVGFAPPASPKYVNIHNLEYDSRVRSLTDYLFITCLLLGN